MVVDIITLARECPGTIVSVNAADFALAIDKSVDNAVKRITEALSKKDNAVELQTREFTRTILNVSNSTLWRWEKSGYLVPINVGGQSRYKTSDINEILEGKR